MKILILLLILLPFFYGCNNSDSRKTPTSTGNKTAKNYNITLAPQTPQKGDTLSVGLHKLSSDQVTFKWFVNNNLVPKANERLFKTDKLKRGDKIFAVVTLKTDAGDYESDEVVIVNSPPLIKGARIVPEKPGVKDILKVNVEAVDVDDDSVILDYRWFKNFDLLPGMIEGTLGKINIVRGDRISVEITPDDGIVSGESLRLYTIIDNSPPTVHISESTFKDGLFSQTVFGEDPDNDEIVYDLLEGPEGMEINESTGEITWRPVLDDRGSHKIIVNLTDGHTGETKVEFSVDVN